jgi:hypothetical protein
VPGVSTKKWNIRGYEALLADVSDGDKDERTTNPRSQVEEADEGR